jgi:hypothetical protein
MISSLRERFNRQSLIGIFLVVILFSLAGDEFVRFLVTQVPGPGIDEALPCSFLESPSDLAYHQSLVGRTVAGNQPLRLLVRTSAIPANEAGTFIVRILLINDSMGTVPIVYTPEEVIIGDNQTSGLGVTFNPASNIFTPGVNLRNDPATYPLNRIRLLGPQQRCIHRINLPRNQLDQSLLGGGSTVTAYYRGTSTGTVPAVGALTPTPIFPDQGLVTGLMQSPPATIPPPAVGGGS